VSGGRGSVYKRGATWTAHIKWQHHGQWRQRKTGGFATKKDAQRALDKMLHAVDLGAAVPADRLTVEQYLTGWLDHLTVVVGRKETTVYGYRATLWRYAVPAFGSVPVQKVATSDLDKLYASMAGRGLSARTIRYQHAVLRKAFGDAERQGLVGVNVALRAAPPSTIAARAPKLSTWTVEQLAEFLTFVTGRQHAEAIWFAAFTGCRRGEVLGLRWSDLDLDAGTVAIAQTVTEAGNRPVVTTPKNHRTRTVALDAGTVAMLRRHRRAQAEWRLHVGRHWRDLDLVFAGPDGGYARPAGLSQQFDRLVAASGLPRIRLHDLRHTHATLLVAAGEDPKLVSERLGHATVGFTLDRYVHPTVEQQAGAVDRFADRLRNVR
jgi:integrase